MSSRPGGLAYDAVLFDMDGVLTATAKLHEAAWKETFDHFLSEYARRSGSTFQPFTSADYRAFVDGRLREDGVREFLRSRGITLPEGTASSPPDEESVRGLGNRKNRSFEARIGPDTVEVYPGSLAVLHSARSTGMKTGVVSASTNCQAILRAAGLADLFDTVVDGKVAAELHLAGKPAPDTFLEAARRLGVPPGRAIVVEDAIAGIRAAREGGFGLAVGLDRHGRPGALRLAGAHIVVPDLWSILYLFSPHPGPKFHRVLRTHEKLARLSRVADTGPWSLCLTAPAPDLVSQIETLFALSNGYLGIRGSVEEGSPSFRPATLLNGFHDTWPIVYGEEAYGFARTGQTIVDAPDGMRMRLFVDDAHFSPESDDISDYRRTLHLDRGELERTVIWRLHNRCRVRVRTRRIVSLVDRHLACMIFEVEALDKAVSVSVASELADPPFQQASNESVDPRQRRGVAGVQLLRRKPTADGVHAAFLTRSSGLALACGMAHQVTSGSCRTEVRLEEQVTRVVFTGRLEPGTPLRIEKYVAYHHSGTRFTDELLFRLEQTLEHARRLGATEIFSRHQAAFRDLWRDADVQLEGSAALQFAIRFNLFHLIQATARVEGFGVPAKGLTGTGYEGHYFWDTEMYIVPWLIYTRPRIARSLLVHRSTQLPKARQWARHLGQQGALFPWRTINGDEASANYAAGTAQYHINADIAYAIRKYVDVTGDRGFMETYGAEILVETARVWADLGFFSDRKDGRFVINRVTGPDEYTTVVDNNLFTNLMARENMQMAAATVDWMRVHSPGAHDCLVAATGLKAGEPDFWRRAASHMYLPFDSRQNVYLQDESFLDLAKWDFDGTPPGCYPLLLHYHPLVIHRYQVIKQPDVMLAAFLLGNEFSLEEKRRIFEYYDPLTTGDSSLSPSIQAIVACEVGEEEVAYRYLVESAVVDLADDNENVRDGIHLAACAGTWMALVNGFAGMRDYDGKLSFRPVLPPHWSRLRFRLRHKDGVLEVDLRQGEATYRLLEGERLSLLHGDEEVVLGRDETSRRPIAPIPPPGWSAIDLG